MALIHSAPERMKTKTFYHASLLPFKEGDMVKPGRKRGYVCLATTPKQGEYWRGVLASSRRLGAKAGWKLFAVELPIETPVEDCRGHYHFEYPGEEKLAGEVEPHTDVDGEVNVRQPIKVVGEIPAEECRENRRRIEREQQHYEIREQVRWGV